MPAPSASDGDEGVDDGPPLPWKVGPQHIDLGHGATLDLPLGRRFLGLPEAAQLMEKMGNLYNDDLLGIAVSDADDADYVVSLRYDEEGFIKDDDKLDAKENCSSRSAAARTSTTPSARSEGSRPSTPRVGSRSRPTTRRPTSSRGP